MEGCHLHFKGFFKSCLYIVESFTKHSESPKEEMILVKLCQVQAFGTIIMTEQKRFSLEQKNENDFDTLVELIVLQSGMVALFNRVCTD